MNHVHRIRHSLATLTRRAGIPTARHAEVPAVPRPDPPRGTIHWPLPAPARTITTPELRAAARPQAPQERLWSRALPARLPHTIQLCIHCDPCQRPDSGSAAQPTRPHAGPGACPAARDWTGTAAT
jgi:hypothetical protein